MAKARKRRKKGVSKTPYDNRKVVAVRKTGVINRLTLSCGHTFDKADPVDRALPIPKRHKCYKCKLKMPPDVKLKK